MGLLKEKGPRCGKSLDFIGRYAIIGGMVGLAQMVRASDCGPEGHRFNSGIPPQIHG